MSSRLQSATSALHRAFEEDKLRSGSFAYCAVAALVEGRLGRPDPRWGQALTAYLYDLPLPLGTPSIEYYSELTGYSPDELLQIEGAFEGCPMSPGIRRVAMGREEPVYDRFERVMQAINSLEGQDTPVFETEEALA